MENKEKELTMQPQEVRRIEKSPFSAVYDGERWRVGMRNMLSSEEEFTTFEDAEKYVNSAPWELIAVFCIEFINTLKLNKDE